MKGLLATIKGMGEPDEYLKYHLHKHLARKEPARTHKRVNASMLTREEYQFCPREVALLDITKRTRPDEFLSTSQQVTFQIGRDLQDYVVETFALLGQAIANWKCDNCGTMHTFQKKPGGCKTCHCKSFAIEEYRFQSAISGASCGIDMLWNHNSQVHTVCEIKSMDKDKFKELQAPLAEHKLRTNLYLRLVAESDDPNKNRVRQDRAKILYISKGGFGCADTDASKWGIPDAKFSPFKEFWIDRDDSQTDAIVAPALRLKEFREKTKGIPHGICKTTYGKRAMSCPMIKECFSGKYPPQD